ncbi:MAG TPA: ATP-grasp domain-containing protein [Candidatus Krumholzibacteriaceae bacterium]|nr:ATP-grasp domain-containing protein [Candidatus Krumholzibacteriaceae bacterium]
MFFADKPYISEFFRTTVRDNPIPVVNTDMAKKLGLYRGTNLVSEEEAVEIFRNSDNPSVYTTSENSIGWISKHLAFSGLPGKIGLFKDKIKFRRLTESVFRKLFFREVRAGDLEEIRFEDLPLPFVIKPAVGFFSMGVYKVPTREEWVKTIGLIAEEIEQLKGLYPEEVLDTGSFIIEEYVEGEEFAVDAYYDSSGEAVILGILKHIFSSDDDVSDRVYITSKEIIEDNIEEFTDFAGKIGRLAGVKNFPVHIELRRDSSGALLPVEVNPMRFGAWCTTADISYLAYRFNPYLYYYSRKRPEWPRVLEGKEGKLYALIVLDNSTGTEGGRITSFDYDKLLSRFENPLELRKIDYREYPVFGFLLTETSVDNFVELERILDSDLKEFISTD